MSLVKENKSTGNDWVTHIYEWNLQGRIIFCAVQFTLLIKKRKKKRKKEKERKRKKTAPKKLSETSVFGNKSIGMFRIYAIIWFESSLQRTIRNSIF